MIDINGVKARRKRSPVFISFISFLHEKLQHDSDTLEKLSVLYSVHWDINPLQKHHPLFLAKSPLKSVKCPNPLFLGNPPYILAFREPPP